MNKKNKTALIFGISGQDGSLLANFLIKKGYNVHGTSRNVEKNKFTFLKRLNVYPKLKLYSLFLNDFEGILKILSLVKPDEIYNLAGQSSVALSFLKPKETYESIFLTSQNLLEAIRIFNKNIKFYNACSSECFGDTGNLLAGEKTPFNPISPYGIAKAKAFEILSKYRNKYNLYLCSGILFNHESFLRPHNFVTRKISSTVVRIKSGSQEKIKLGNLSIRRDWGWAEEYIEAMWLMLQQEVPEDYVIATGETNSLENFVDCAFSHCNLDWKNHVEIDKRLFRKNEIYQCNANALKANKNLNWFAKTKMNDVVLKMVKYDKQLINKSKM